MGLKNKQTKYRAIKTLGALAIATGVTFGGLTINSSVNNMTKRYKAYDDCLDIRDEIVETDSFLEYFGSKYETLKGGVESDIITTEEMYDKLQDTMTVEHIYENRDKIIDSEETKEKLEDSYVEYLKYNYKNPEATAFAGLLTSMALLAGGVLALKDTNKQIKKQQQEVSNEIDKEL